MNLTQKTTLNARDRQGQSLLYKIQIQTLKNCQFWTFMINFRHAIANLVDICYNTLSNPSNF